MVYDADKVERTIEKVKKTLDEELCNNTEIQEIFARIRWDYRDAV